MTRFLRALAGATATASLALLAIGTPVASASTTHSGVFRGDIVKTDCSNPPPWVTTSGTWAVTLHGNTATGVFDIYVDGQPHFAYKFPGMKQQPVGAHQLFSVTGMTGAGPLTLTATDKGKFTYTIAPYNLQYDADTLYSCASVTFPGRLTS